MATAKIPNCGETYLLTKIFKGTETYGVFFYESDTTPSETDTLATYTTLHPSLNSGYYPAAAEWTLANGVASCPAQTFNITGATTIYGMLMRCAGSEITLVSAMRFDTPIVVPAGGGQVVVIPKFTLVEEA